MVHENTPARAGADPSEANAAVVMTHGRGATARSILAMHREFPRDDVAYAAPQATNNTWYPHSFLEPVEKNEPGRTGGLDAIDRIVEGFVDDGIERENVLLMGFSQGACLTSEYAATRPERYGGVAALSGGVIGDEVGEYEGDMAGTEVFLGCSDVDPHIPVERVHDTRDVFESLGADVEERIYEGMGHGVNEDELDYLRGVVADL
ncbi:alpha/beta hydrolase [Halosegnis marinus]|uniref:Alpha/beta hydrolase n=1 Tax=Halosegnis marinus TaxID=3034023 RepID=A0ABD5ZL11_9EURY|nr:dienelactone hydrolase family protein [Halosegnis sp. DT85]